MPGACRRAIMRRVQPFAFPAQRFRLATVSGQPEALRSRRHGDGAPRQDRAPAFTRRLNTHATRSGSSTRTATGMPRRRRASAFAPAAEYRSVNADTPESVADPKADLIRLPEGRGTLASDIRWTAVSAEPLA